MSGPRPIGTGVRRVDGLEKVTGQARFVADMLLPGMLHARVVRSPHAHARIVSIDVSRALALPGVKAVVTGEDCPDRIGVCIKDQWPLARFKVRFTGEPVAAVIATSEEVARKAASMVGVEYEPLPVVLDPEAAAAPGAPLVHEDLGEYWHLPTVFPRADSNVFHHFRLRRGRVEENLARADLVVSNRFVFPSLNHVALEPHGAVAQYIPGQGVNIWTSSQAPFVVRSVVARILGLSPSAVRVVVPYVGGGFGGKSDVTIEPLAAVVAQMVPGRPVRLVLDREEVFVGTLVGRGLVAYLTTGVTSDGRILAEKITLYWNGGAYADYAVNIVTGGGYNSPGPYEIGNIWVDSLGVYTNTPPTGACRGYGHPEVHWACERQREILARRLGLDPVQFRLQNCLAPGKVNSLGQVIREHNGRLDLCVRAVAGELGGGAGTGHMGSPYRRVGRGLAVFGKSPVMASNAQSGALVRLNEDGSATVSVGAVEMGQGVYTVLTQIAAEVLGVPPDRVRVVPFVDTEFSPYEWQTVASHTTWAVGKAVMLAAQDALEQAVAVAANLLDVRPDDLVAGGGRLFVKDNPENGVALADLAVGYAHPDGRAASDPIIGRATFAPRDIQHPDPETGQGNCAASWTFGCQGAEVEVDTQTGEILVRKLITAIDAGRIINPSLARGQVVGAMVQAMGAALSEHLIYSRAGKMRNATLTDYKIPTALDIPDEFRVIFIETPDASGPYAARGLGEHGAVAVAPAVANAVSGAAGIEFLELPMTAERVIELLRRATA
ncbi:MAG TPA: xanthine dehydrogenase family protein molybdopterin-binding subunit [Firmicutes bacterium]|nr:xanthine dehydrogenase family protein molybdopterin-binding subunit [Bacillota bacterium]